LEDFVHSRLSVVALAAAALMLVAAGLSPLRADAHERRTVAGKYTFVVGFLTEPAINGQVNGIDLRITDAQTNQAVEGVEKTLKTDIAVGGQSKTYELKTRFNMPGAYTVTLIPTKAGQWIFRFYGTIEGTQVDEKFESGPGRFDDVEAAATFEFPAAQSSPGAAGSEGEGSASAMAEAQRALDKADSARTIGIFVGTTGLLAGLVGIGLAVVALNARRGRPSRRDPIEPV
jgi:hypothetical protein